MAAFGRWWYGLPELFLWSWIMMFHIQGIHHFQLFILMCMKGRFLKGGAGRSQRGACLLETDFEKNKVMPSEWGIPKIRACRGWAKGCLFQEHLTSRPLTDVKSWHKINFIHLFCMIRGRYIYFLLLRLDRYHGKEKKKWHDFQNSLPFLDEKFCLVNDILEIFLSLLYV